MKPRKIKACLLAAVMAAGWSNTARAQSCEPFNPYCIFNPGVEAWQMTRSGGLVPSLYSGEMTFSILLYEYSDSDFHIPVSLEYGFGGYRPAQHSGPEGYGWYLNCGGVITREVRGMPDEGAEQQNSIFYYPVKGWPSTVSAGLDGSSDLRSVHIAFKPVQDADEYVSSFKSYDPFSDIPVALHGGCLYDMKPDLWHFRIPGHSGDFMFLNDGNARVYNSDMAHGDVIVNMENNGIKPKDAVFIIKTGDGYEYRFGVGGISYTRSLLASERRLPESCVTEFRLKSIEAPSGRRAVFNYKPIVSRKSAVWYSPCHNGVEYPAATYFSSFNELSMRGCNVVSEEYDVLTEIKIEGTGGELEAAIVFTYDTAPLDEFASDCYEEPEIHSFASPGAQQRLVMMEVRNASSDVVADAYMSYIQGTGVPKSFLSGVSGSRFGRYAFAYNLSKPLPANDTPSTDHWGFWNGSGTSDIRSHIVPIVPDTAPGSLYSQMTDGVKDPDGNYGGIGALTRITYPTGGSTAIEYEPNKVRRRLDLNASGTGVSVTQVDPDGGGESEAGGVRVKRLTDSDLCGNEYTTEYEYCDGSSAGSGILMRMPRYSMSACYVQNAVDHININCRVETNNVTAYEAGIGESALSMDGHVAYTDVKAMHPDGSYTVYKFSSIADEGCEDLRSGGIWITKHIVNGIDLLNNEGHGAHELLAISHDRKNMRGRLLCEYTCDIDGTEMHRLVNEYGTDAVTVFGTADNETYHYTLADYSVSSPVLISVSETLHGLNVKTAYDYNSHGQVRRVSRTGSYAGTSLTGIQEQNNERYRYLWESDASTTLLSAKDAAVRTRVDAQGTERVTAAQSYAYAQWEGSHNPKPTLIASYPHDGSAVLQSSDDFESAMAAGLAGIPRTTTITYDISTLHPITLAFSGGAYISYTWDGKNIASRTDNGAGNTRSFSWKDMVGPVLITSPAGEIRSYGYDDACRLSSEADGHGNVVKMYDYKLMEE